MPEFAPLTEDERRRQADWISAAPARPRTIERCAVCRSAVRRVREGGIDTEWCGGCQRYIIPAVVDAVT